MGYETGNAVEVLREALLEDGWPHLFQSDSFTGITVAPTRLGDIALKNYPSYTLVGGFYVGELEPAGYTLLPNRPAAFTNQLAAECTNRLVYVNPIPEDRMEEVAGYLRDAGYSRELDFNPEPEGRMTLRKSATGLRLSPEEFENYMDVKTGLGYRLLERGLGREAWDVVCEIDSNARRQGRYTDRGPYVDLLSSREFKDFYAAASNQAFPRPR